MSTEFFHHVRLEVDEDYGAGYPDPPYEADDFMSISVVGVYAGEDINISSVPEDIFDLSYHYYSDGGGGPHRIIQVVMIPGRLFCGR